jgi:HEPN domain-containing protein
MAEDSSTAAREWLVKAQHDLRSACLLSRGEEFYLDVAIYLCQQGTEKALKAFLVYHGRTAERTHDPSGGW